MIVYLVIAILTWRVDVTGLIHAHPTHASSSLQRYHAHSGAGKFVFMATDVSDPDHCKTAVDVIFHKYVCGVTCVLLLHGIT